MKETFEYLYTVKAEDSIEVEDVGNCCLKVLNDTGYEWFLVIDTKLGDCFVKTFGPFNVDIENHFIHGFKFDFSKIEYIKMSVKLAKNHGIYGFAIIYYWFSGKILYDEPINIFLKNKTSKL